MRTAIYLNNLGLLYTTQEKYTEAESLYQRALTIDEKSLGVEHPEVATVLKNLADLYLAQGKNDRAEPLQYRVQAIREKASL